MEMTNTIQNELLIKRYVDVKGYIAGNINALNTDKYKKLIEFTNEHILSMELKQNSITGLHILNIELLLPKTFVYNDLLENPIFTKDSYLYIEYFGKEGEGFLTDLIFVIDSYTVSKYIKNGSYIILSLKGIAYSLYKALNQKIDKTWYNTPIQAILLEVCNNIDISFTPLLLNIAELQKPITFYSNNYTVYTIISTLLSYVDIPLQHLYVNNLLYVSSISLASHEYTALLLERGGMYEQSIKQREVLYYSLLDWKINIPTFFRTNKLKAPTFEINTYLQPYIPSVKNYIFDPLLDNTYWNGSYLFKNTITNNYLDAIYPTITYYTNKIDKFMEKYILYNNYQSTYHLNALTNGSIAIACNSNVGVILDTVHTKDMKEAENQFKVQTTTLNDFDLYYYTKWSGYYWVYEIAHVFLGSAENILGETEIQDKTYRTYFSAIKALKIGYDYQIKDVFDIVKKGNIINMSKDIATTGLKPFYKGSV